MNATLPSSPLALTRLNSDNSWLLEIDGTSILLDPWLEGAAVVVVPALHVAWQPGEPVPVSGLPRWDALVLSQPFADHCQTDTLQKLPKDAAVYAPAVAVPVARRLGGFRAVHTLPNATRGGKAVAVGEVDVAYFRAASLFDPTHNVVVFRGRRSGTTVLHAPHGLRLGTRTAAAVEAFLGGPPDALLCTFTRYGLPFYLGGVANLGAEAAVALAAHLRPRAVFRTHDAVKPEQGFIARVASYGHCEDPAAALAAAGVATEAPEIAIGARWTPPPSGARERGEAL